jgi:hypothetical protein
MHTKQYLEELVGSTDLLSDNNSSFIMPAQ